MSHGSCGWRVKCGVGKIVFHSMKSLIVQFYKLEPLLCISTASLNSFLCFKSQIVFGELLNALAP